MVSGPVAQLDTRLPKRWPLRWRAGSSCLLSSRFRVQLMKYIVYIIESETSRKTYTGFSDNPVRRVREHNGGKTKTTRNKGPWIIIHQEPYATRLEARKREKFLKSGLGRKFIKEKIQTPRNPIIDLRLRQSK
jgi:putative endonuclease